MVKNFVLIAFLAILGLVFGFIGDQADAVAPSIEWSKCYGGTAYDEARSFQRTSDGGYIFAGFTWSKDGDVSGNKSNSANYWVVKLNASGVIEWQKAFGGSAYDIARDIQQTSEGGYIFCGRTYSKDGDVIGKHEGEGADMCGSSMGLKTELVLCNIVANVPRRNQRRFRDNHPTIKQRWIFHRWEY
jgi:hypothetical protein